MGENDSLRLERGQICRLDILHPDDVVAAIDMVHLPRHPGAEIRQQVKPGAADLLNGDVAGKRRVVLVPAQDVAEIADPAGGEWAGVMRKKAASSTSLAPT